MADDAERPSITVKELVKLLGWPAKTIAVRFKYPSPKQEELEPVYREDYKMDGPGRKG